MAVNAAHITSSLHTKPSIFEVIAQDSLSELLYPSFKILVQFLGSNNPDRYQWLNKWSEEVFLGLNGILQIHYLSCKGSSFSESFYGLRRVNDVQQSCLSTKAKLWSLFCLVGLPYAARKSEQVLARLHNPKVDLCHRGVRACWQSLTLVQYLLYLTGRATAHSPLLSVANISLQYCPEEPERPFQWWDLISNPKEGLRLLGHSATQALQLAAFFLQCLQWWHSDSFGHSVTSTPVPPPPPPPQLQISDVDSSNSGICPLCKEPWKIETALLTSGYVFCYRCLKEYVSSHRKCPITGMPTSLDELIRLYPTK